MLGTKLQLEYDGILCIFQILRYHRNSRAITQEIEQVIRVKKTRGAAAPRTRITWAFF